MHNYKSCSLIAVFGLSMLASASATALDFDVGDTKVSLYGSIKASGIYDVKKELPSPTGNNRNVALDDQHRAEGVFQADARYSRIGFKTETATDKGPFRTVIEYDFASGDGGGLRLRHAYGEWNNLIVGQTWTNFGKHFGQVQFIDSLPPPGVLPTRQAQVRYTSGKWAVALEEAKKLGGSVASDNAKTGLPDATISYTSNIGSTRYALGGVLRELSADDGDGGKDSAVGWGANLAIQSPLSYRVTLRATLAYGEGIGGYLNFAPAAPAYEDPTTGDVETIRAYGGALGFQVKVGPGTINLSHGLAISDIDDAVASGALAADANETFTSTHLNYIWWPMQKLEYGFELARHTREVFNGDDGDALRIQAMARYHF